MKILLYKYLGYKRREPIVANLQKSRAENANGFKATSKIKTIQKGLNPMSKPFYIGAFGKLREAIITFGVCLDRPSVRTAQLGSHWTNFQKNCHLNFFFFRKSAEKTQLSFKSDKNNGYFT